VPVPKVSVVCEVSILDPPEVSVVKPGGLLSVLSEPDTLLSGELQAIAYDKTAKNNIFLIRIRIEVRTNYFSSNILPSKENVTVFI
jgi:hypothetical protein